MTLYAKHSCILFLIIVGVILAALQKLEPRVQISNGLTIVGQVNRTIDKNKIYFSFRGIPFAQPPIGKLRFKHPVALSGNFSLTTVFAFTDGSGCVQPGSLVNLVFGSEDCLYLNVYTPQLPQPNTPLLPVIVWIHGGYFLLGSNSYESYGPDYFLDENVLMVTVNYRLGIFGFLSTEDNVSPGNYGLKDQILALKWVKENIAYFGGNPNLVTIYGESAGSISASYLTQSNLTKGLFQRAIFESGTTLCLWGFTRNPKSTAVTIATILGVDVLSSKSLVNGLRKVDSTRLQIATMKLYYTKLLFNNILDGLPFGPSMEPLHPGAVVVAKNHEQLQHGVYHRIPYLMGFNSLEAVYFVMPLMKYAWYLLPYELGLIALVPESMNIQSIIMKAIVNFMIRFYYFFINIIPTTLQVEKFISDDQFTRPILESTRLISRSAPVYQYVFSYLGALGKATNESKGVGHSQELPYLFRMSDNYPNPSASDLLTRYRLIRMWTNFAKTGNPTPHYDPLLQNVIWPLTTAPGEDNLAYLNISQDLIPGTNPSRKSFSFWNSLFRMFGIPPYNTY